MKNKISDLRNYMFEALERLSAEGLTPDELDREIKRAAAVSEVGKVIVDSAKTEVTFLKLTGKKKQIQKISLRKRIPNALPLNIQIIHL